MLSLLIGADLVQMEAMTSCQAAAAAEGEADAAAEVVSLLQVGGAKRFGHTAEGPIETAAEVVAAVASEVLGGETTADDSSWCGLQGQPGFATLYTDLLNGTVLVDLTDALQNGKRLQVVVTAMSVAGSWLDGVGQLSRLGEPLEETENTMFELRASDDHQKVEVYRPSLGRRTTDRQSRKALRRGIGDGWLGGITRLRCDYPGKWTRVDKYTAAKEGDRIVIDGDGLIRNGFWVAPSLTMQTFHRLRSARAFPRNFVVDVEFEMQAPRAPLSVGFSMLALAEEPMPSRAHDDRLLFFSTTYQDMGDHHASPQSLPSEIVDRHTSMIWRHNLAALPGNQIRIHVDPTVPRRWRQHFRDGVEAWNAAFAPIGQPQAVRAVLPEDPDWPPDYDIGDARFSTISWSVSDYVSSVGIAKVDPRSGEILKSDIMMSDGWVQAWLADLEIFRPNFTQSLGQAGGHHTELFLLRSHVVHEKAGGTGTEKEVKLSPSLAAARLRRRTSLLDVDNVEKPLDEAERERRKIIGQGLKQIVMHETGHILGLRHNFKGSLGVSYECTQDINCSAVQGLSASVMDYMPMNVPEIEGREVHAFSPILGGYDKLAIAYGYMSLPNEAGPRLRGPPQHTASELLKVLSDAEAYEVCYDDDANTGQDPTCVPYDISADPLRYSEALLARYAKVQQHLLSSSVAPGAPYERYGDAVQRLIYMVEDIGINSIYWLGGINASYVHRGLNGTPPNRPALTAVPAVTQRRALRLLLQVLRPEKNGLLPPKEHLPFLVGGQGFAESDGHVSRLDLGRRVRLMAHGLVAEALSVRRVEQIYATESLLGGTSSAMGSSDTPVVLGCGEYLAELVSGIMGSDPSAADVAASLAVTVDPAEWDLQTQFVKSLKALHRHAELPSEVASLLQYHIQRLKRDLEAALVLVGNRKQDVAGPVPGGKDLLRSHLALLRQELSKAWLPTHKPKNAQRI